MGLLDRVKHGWNAFLNKDPTAEYSTPGMIYSNRPDRVRFSRGNERTIVSSIYNRIAIDAASINIQHVRLDENKRYVETMDSPLNNCLTLEANKDQTSRAFLQDAVSTLLDEGCIAIVPVDTDRNPKLGTYDIWTMRVGKVVEWRPDHVKINLYNDRIGRHDEILLPKSDVAIIENPLYAVMNEPNGTLRRLARKLSILDAIDEQSGSGKLDLIIQLPYITKTETKKKQAEERRKMLEDQLSNSKFGIGYIDGTEHITQLNRSVENNLMKQIEYLTEQLYSQLGITTEVMNGTADEATMLNYHNRTIEPILSAIVDEFKRKFLTQTARTRGQSISFFRDPFRLVPVLQLADIADKFTRNEIMTSNEIRAIIGMKPSKDPGADELRNKNISQSADAKEKEETITEENGPNGSTEKIKEEIQNA